MCRQLNLSRSHKGEEGFGAELELIQVSAIGKGTLKDSYFYWFSEKLI